LIEGQWHGKKFGKSAESKSPVGERFPDPLQRRLEKTRPLAHGFPEERIPVKKEFYVIIERDEDGFFVGEVPRLRGCYAQGKTLDELMKNIEEVIKLCLEEEEADEIPSTTFIGVQKIEIDDSPAIA